MKKSAMVSGRRRLEERAPPRSIQSSRVASPDVRHKQRLPEKEAPVASRLTRQKYVRSKASTELWVNGEGCAGGRVGGCWEFASGLLSDVVERKRSARCRWSWPSLLGAIELTAADNFWPRLTFVAPARTRPPRDSLPTADLYPRRTAHSARVLCALPRSSAPSHQDPANDDAVAHA